MLGGPELAENHSRMEGALRRLMANRDRIFGAVADSQGKVPRLVWKRPLDLVLGAAALVVLAPAVLAIGVLIRIDSPGPALFRQQRVGRNGLSFQMWKFRSMYVRSDDAPHREAAAAWFAAAPSPGGYKLRDDPRITRMGRLLRRTSLDELPQLLNVIRGEMSLVGPRPAIPYELAHYEPTYFERQLVKPGMTGLWQVLGRDRLPAPEMMALDRRYVRECSLLLDLKILATTIPALAGHGPRQLA